VVIGVSGYLAFIPNSEEKLKSEAREIWPPFQMGIEEKRSVDKRSV
jgi:hypothetical protein